MALESYQRVLERIQKACLQSGRNPDEVRLLAVSKTFPIEAIREIYELGQRDFGENYVQEAAPKIASLPEARWHLIGPLQSNKANQAVAMFPVMHSLDRLSLARKLEEKALAAGKVMQAFVQVRLGDEDSKSGLDPREFLREMESWNAHSWKALKLIGLMTLPPPHLSRPYFAELRNLRDRLRQEAWPLFSDYQLSMGMSDDFEDAIAEGSNWVRVGRALFGERPQKGR